jgi:hypothetical protein
MIYSDKNLRLCGYRMEPEPIRCFFIFFIWERGKTNPPKARIARRKRRNRLLDRKLRPAPLTVRRRARLRAAEFPGYPATCPTPAPDRAE